MPDVMGTDTDEAVSLSFDFSFVFLMFPDSSHYKTYNGSCFMYLSEMLIKLQMVKGTHFMKFSDGLLIYVILLINHTHIFYLPWS